MINNNHKYHKLLPQDIFCPCSTPYSIIVSLKYVLKEAVQAQPTMFQNFDLTSGLSVLILDFSDKKIVRIKVYNVTRIFDEYSDYTPSLTCPSKHLHTFYGYIPKNRQCFENCKVLAVNRHRKEVTFWRNHNIIIFHLAYITSS